MVWIDEGVVEVNNGGEIMTEEKRREKRIGRRRYSFGGVEKKGGREDARRHLQKGR